MRISAESALCQRKEEGIETLRSYRRVANDNFLPVNDNKKDNPEARREAMRIANSNSSSPLARVLAFIALLGFGIGGGAVFLAMVDPSLFESLTANLKENLRS